MRSYLTNREPEVVNGFRMRGREVSRTESFSDAVFGFALTLLVVSLDVPKGFDELFRTMRSFPAFTVCFTLLAMIWNSHYKFCRRYGLDDLTTRTLTLIMLFLVLFFVYPLKFLFNVSITTGGAAPPMEATFAQVSTLLTIYGVGFAAVYAALGSLYCHAWRVRDQLELNDAERFDTRHSIYRFIMVVTIGLLAALLAQFRPIVQWSGMTYLLLFPVLRGHSMFHRRRRARRWPTV